MRKKVLAAFLVAALLTSCYPQKNIVGTGPKKNIETTKWNHYLIMGLAPVGVVDTKELAKGDSSYSIYTRHTIINWLVAGITFGIYTPTTTTVTR